MNDRARNVLEDEMEKKLESSENERVRVKMMGVEVIYHKTIVEVERGMYERMKDAQDAKDPLFLDNFIGGFFSEKSVVDKEFESCEVSLAKAGEGDDEELDEVEDEVDDDAEDD